MPGRRWQAAKKKKTRGGVLPAIQAEFTLRAQMPPDPSPFYVQVFLNMKYTIYPPSQEEIRKRKQAQEEQRLINMSNCFQRSEFDWTVHQDEAVVMGRVSLPAFPLQFCTK